MEEVIDISVAHAMKAMTKARAYATNVKAGTPEDLRRHSRTDRPQGARQSHEGEVRMGRDSGLQKKAGAAVPRPRVPPWLAMQRKECSIAPGSRLPMFPLCPSNRFTGTCFREHGGTDRRRNCPARYGREVLQIDEVVRVISPKRVSEHIV